MKRKFRYIILVFLFAGIGCKAQFLHFDSLIRQSVYLPASFDLRETTRLSQVRVQPTGGCWASSVMSSVESFMASSGFGHWSLSDKNLQFFNGFNKKRNTYGNHLMATAYFSRGSGPLLQSPKNDTLPREGRPLAVLITQARFLPNDPDLIKHTIKDFGAVYSMLYFRKELVDSVTNVLYASREGINHVVCLAGWDDSVKTDDGTGVWIAQNSLGTKFGDEGFFYIPYQDKNILQYNAVWPEWIPYDPNLEIYYYDTLGSYNSYGFGDTVCYGLVEYTADHPVTLKSVGTFINHDSTTIKADIYNGFDTTTKQPVALVASTGKIKCVHKGYYKVELTTDVHINGGQKFFIMMKYVTPSDTMPLPVESFVNGYSKPNLATGKCYVNPDFERWPGTWYECGKASPYHALKFDLCIKAYLLRDE